jgi:hypothetical protein
MIEEYETKLVEGKNVVAAVEAEISKWQALRDGKLMELNGIPTDKAKIEYECQKAVIHYVVLTHDIDLVNTKSQMDELKKKHPLMMKNPPF